jgi:SAM-dependent methyltransferase
MDYASGYYESPAGALCLLIEHYGQPGEILPGQHEVTRLCGTKNSALDEAMRRINLPRRRRALDLGCAVGGGVFGLRRYFDQAVGIDRSPPLLAQARTLRRTRETTVTWAVEGFPSRSYLIRLPDDAVTDGIEFIEADLNALPADLGLFDLVMIEKVPECLPDPRRFLTQIPGLIAPGGYFMHVSSYRWHTDFTAPEKQLGSPQQVPAQIDEILEPDLKREGRFNVPFILENDATGFFFGVAEALLWKRC